MKNRIWKWSKDAGRIIEISPGAVPDVDAPYVQDDSIPPTVSHATDEGLVFTSRSKLYEHYRQHGFECTGGSHLTGKGIRSDPRKFECAEERARKAAWGMLKVDSDIRAEVAESLRKIKWGMAPLTDREKSICQKEQERYREYARRQRS